MGMFDEIRKKAEKAVDQHGDKIATGIDKAAATASKRTGGKHDAKITKGSTAAKKAFDRLDGRNDDIPDHGTDRPPPSTPAPAPAPPPAPSQPAPPEEDGR